MSIVPNHGAKNHLVPVALGAPVTSRHPGLGKDGHALEEPARTRFTRRRQILVKDRLRVFRLGNDLAAKELARSTIGGGGLIRVGDVHEFVIHDRVHAWSRGGRLERQGEGGNVDGQCVTWRRVGAGVAEIGEIGQQDRDLVVRHVAENTFLPIGRIVECLDDPRDQVGFGRIEIKQPQFVGLDLAQ